MAAVMRRWGWLCALLCAACGTTEQRWHRPNFAPPRLGVFVEPVPMVASTEDDLLPTLSASGGVIAYAGRVNGNLDIYTRPLAGGAPLRLTSHSTDDTDPAFSPDGTQLAWISQTDDVKGDVWVMDAQGGDKRRLSGRDTADQAPFWSPDGKQVFFTCRAAGTALRRIDAVDIKTSARRTVVPQGWDGSVSPDGEVLFYVNFDGQKRPRVFARRLSDQHEVALTDATAIEATPRAGQSGTQTVVVFARFVDDINDDGVLDVDDAPSLWSVPFNATERFAGAAPAVPQPLTAGEGGEIFAAMMHDWLVYTAAGRGDLEIFALPLSGMIAPEAAPATVLAAGRAASEPALRRLALRSLVANSPQQAGPAHYELARELAERGKLPDAITELQRAEALAGDTSLGWVAALEAMRLEMLWRLHSRLLVREANDRTWVQSQRAALATAAAKHPADAAVRARATFIGAEMAYALGERGQAVDAWEALLRSPEVPSEDGARALDRLGEAYQALGDLAAVARVSEQCVRRFGDERFWAQRAAERWVQSAQQTASGAPAAALEAMVSTQQNLPVVAARAAAALAQWQARHGQEALALQNWQHIAATFASEREVLVQALLAIGESAVQAGAQDAALAAYERLLAEFPEDPALRAQARRGLTTLALQEAQEEERRGQLAQARQTYRRLLHSNPELVLALRRSIALSATLGDLADELKTYAQAAKAAPRDKLARYAYGYALSQMTPPDRSGALREMEAVLALEPRFAAAQLTLGWIRHLREADEPGHGWLEQAAESFETARGLVDARADQEIWAAATLDKGNALFALGKLDDAFSAYLERELAEAPFESPLTELLFRESFSRVALRVDQLDVALDMAYGARRLSAALPGQPRGSALAALLAALNLQAERLDDALRFADEAIARYQSSKDWGHLVPMLRCRALTLRALKRDPEALATFRDLLQLLADGHGPPDPPSGFLVQEIPGNAQNITAAVYGFAGVQEEDIARATAARIFRARVDYATAKGFDAQHLALMRKLAANSRQGPRVRLELLYALHESALTAVGAGDLTQAVNLWREALPIATGEEHWAEATTVMESLQQLWLSHPQSYTHDLAEQVLLFSGNGIQATPDAPTLQQRLARLHALAQARASLRPVQPAADFTAWLTALDNTVQMHVRPALRAAAQSQDPALQAHLDHWLGTGKQALDANLTTATWRQAYDRALWDHAPGADPNNAWMDRASQAFAVAAPSRAPERPAFVAAVVHRLLQAGNTEAAWHVLEQDRLRALQPNPDRVSRETWALPWAALRASRNDPNDYAAKLQAAPALVRALEAAPSALPQVRAALEGDALLVQAFAPNPQVWHWFIVNAQGLQHVQSAPPDGSLPAAVRSAIGPWPATVYVDTGVLLPQPAWTLTVDGKPWGTQAAVAEVLSATYCVAAFEARNLARDVPLTIDPNDAPSTLAAQSPSRSLLHLPLAGRLGGPAAGTPGQAQVVFDRPGDRAEALDLTFLQGLTRNDNLAVVDHVPGNDARLVRAVAQSLLLAGIPTAWVGEGEGLAVSTLVAPGATGRIARPLAIPVPATLRLLGYRGMDRDSQVKFAAADLLALAKTASAAFKEGRDTQSPVAWRRARELFVRLLDTGDFLAQPDSQTRLQHSADKLHQRIAGAVAGLQLTNQGSLADIYLRLHEHTRAIELRENILATAQSGGRPGPIIEALINLGRTLANTDRKPEAVTRLEACVQWTHQSQDQAGEASCQAMLAAARREVYDYGGAQRAFEAAIALQMQNPNASVAEARRQLGFLFESSLSNYDRAQEQFSQALEDAQAHKKTDLVPRLLIDLARVARTRGDYEAALGWVDQARALLTQASPADRAAAALESARIYWYRGAYQRARALEEESLALARQAGDLFLEIQARSLRGLIALNQGELREAHAAISEALDLSRSIGRRSEEASQLNNLGTVQREAGQLVEAASSFRAALRIDEALGSAEGRAYDLRNLAMVFARQNQLAEGLHTVEQALQLSRSIGNRYNELQCLIAEADMREQQQDPQAGARFLESATLARAIAVPEVEWRALYALGRGAQSGGELPQARDLYDQALAVAERLGRGRQETSGGTGHSRDDLYADAADLAVHMHDLPRAYDISERGRQRALQDVLASRMLDLSDSRAKALLDAEVQSRELLLAAQRANPNDVSAAQARHTQALGALFAQAPRLARAMTIAPVPLAQLQRLLPPHTAVLTYLLGSTRTVSLLITAQGIEGLTLPTGAADLHPRISTLHDSLRAFAPTEAILQGLSASLVSPWANAADLQQAHNVVLIPHGVLYQVPFAALPNAQGAPLLSQHTLSLALSAAHLHDTLALPAPTPVQSVTAIAPQADLAFARLEANAVGDTVWLDRDATLTHVATCPSDALDIAAHGDLDSSDPLGSALLLAPEPGNAAGRLELRQVFGLPRVPALVTLSACDSAASESSGGEWLGLGQAFVVAGARSVVASQNRVSDLAAAVLMKRFYRLARHMPAAAALQEAAMGVRAMFPHPAHWANFWLMGDPR